MPEALPIWTIGHSNHDMSTLVRLLHAERIEVLADVRSQPFSRFNPHFNRRPLKSSLGEARIRYAFLGDELGGRPPEPEFFDEEGHVLYCEVAKTPRFLAGLERLLDGSNKFRVAMMCSEENPTDCHRRLLVTRVLVERGVPVVHIRSNGTTISEAELAVSHAGPAQPALFGQKDAPWRSTRSVSQSTPQKISSSR